MSNDICITLDYELCLGYKTGSVHKSLILPMEELVKVFDRYNIKATLMIDAAYLLMLKKNKDKYDALENDYNLIVNQLRCLSENGYSIQLHIHPQWYYSYFDVNEWKLDFNHYKLSDMDSKSVPVFFEESKSLLESIIKKKVVAFRAGGYSLQSYKDHYNLLVSNGIKIDTSAIPGKMEKSKYQWYDYRDTPRHKYKFSNNISKIDDDGKILEIPVSTVSFNPIHYIFLKYRIENFHSFLPFSEGQGIELTYPLNIRMWNLFKQLFRIKIADASIDGFASCLLPLIYEKYKIISDDNIFVILGHPKGASAKSIHFTEVFIKNTIGKSTYKTIEEFL